MDGEADLVLKLTDGFNIDDRRHRRTLASVAAVGERLGDEGERAA